MILFINALKTEIIKFKGSWVPLITFIGISLGPIVGALFMIILKDPKAAKNLGLISTKAQLVGTADWPTLLALLAQVIGIGGSILFGFVATWIFGREFSERTIRPLLAVPTSRILIVAAKFIIMIKWSMLLAIWVFTIGPLLGWLISLPGFSWLVLISGIKVGLVTALLTIALLTLVAFIACVGQGYLAALGFVFLTLFLGQVAGITGWGDWVPWSVPALYSGAAGEQQINQWSIMIVMITSLIGLILTFRWWQQTDHTT